MIRNRNALIAVALVAIFSMAGLIAAENAAGDDYKYLPGMMCFANSGKHEQYLRHYYTGAKNKRTRATKVTCPIIRDNRGNNTMKGVAVFINQAAGNTARCWLRSSNEDGTVTNTSGQSITGTGRVLWDPLPVNAPFRGFMSVQCRLPYNAQLYKFGYYENPGTDTN